MTTIANATQTMVPQFKSKILNELLMISTPKYRMKNSGLIKIKHKKFQLLI